MNETITDVRLLRKRGQVCVELPDGRQIPVRIVWARPLTGRGRQVCFLDSDKREILTLDGLERLDPDSRQIAEAELARRYLIARITRVIRTEAHFGNRYWDVETDCGRRQFVMTDPDRTVIWVTDDHLVIRDTMGNHYEIASLSGLDAVSRSYVDRVV